MTFILHLKEYLPTKSLGTFVLKVIQEVLGLQNLGKVKGGKYL